MNRRQPPAKSATARRQEANKAFVRVVVAENCGSANHRWTVVIAATYCGADRTETLPSERRNWTKARTRCGSAGIGGVPDWAQNAQNRLNLATIERRPDSAFEEASAWRMEARSGAERPSPRGRKLGASSGGHPGSG